MAGKLVVDRGVRSAKIVAVLLSCKHESVRFRGWELVDVIEGRGEGSINTAVNE
jgi:hypothetical protein